MRSPGRPGPWGHPGPAHPSHRPAVHPIDRPADDADRVSIGPSWSLGGPFHTSLLGSDCEVPLR